MAKKMLRWPKRRHRNVSTKSSHAKTIGAAKAHCPRQHTLHTRLSGGQCAALTFFHPPVAPNQILHRENDLPPRLLRSLGAPPRGRWVPMQISHRTRGRGVALLPASGEQRRGARRPQNEVTFRPGKCQTVTQVSPFANGDVWDHKVHAVDICVPKSGTTSAKKIKKCHLRHQTDAIPGYLLDHKMPNGGRDVTLFWSHFGGYSCSKRKPNRNHPGRPLFDPPSPRTDLPPTSDKASRGQRSPETNGAPGPPNFQKLRKNGAAPCPIRQHGRSHLRLRLCLPWSAPLLRRAPGCTKRSRRLFLPPSGRLGLEMSPSEKWQGFDFLWPKWAGHQFTAPFIRTRPPSKTRARKSILKKSTTRKTNVDFFCGFSSDSFLVFFGREMAPKLQNANLKWP